MSGHKSFKILSDRIDADPERRARVEELERTYDEVLALANLRESRGVTQTQLAESLGVSQPNVSKVEHAEDVHLSTIINYVAALGGHLELKAVFPNEKVNLALPREVQQEASDRPSQEATNVYSEFLNSALSFYQEAMSTASQVAQDNMQNAARAAQQGVQAASQAGQQAVEAASQAGQQGAQAADQAGQEESTRRTTRRR
jgi:transcriptional regulator with XRE-family HTH domain